MRHALYGFGGTEVVEFATSMFSQPVRALKAGRRCFIRFIHRQDAVDCYQVSSALEAQYFDTNGALQFFRYHNRWITRWTNNFSTSGNTPRLRTTEIEPLSIYVGRLNPRRITEMGLLQRFGGYGKIQEYSIFDKPGKKMANYRPPFAMLT